MDRIKFNERDRNHVISEIEAHLRVQLTRVGNYRKFLQDGSGRSYWIFGGYEDWHGITSGMMEEEIRRDTDGILVVAKRHKTSIAIFHGMLRPLIAARDELSHTKTGDYQFNVSARGGSLIVKEVSGLTLRRLGEPKDDGRTKVDQTSRLDALVASLSPDDRRRLIERLARDEGSR